MAVESNFSGFLIDPAKFSQLSLEEKRELVHEISLWADNAPEILHSWTRRELLQLICAELGKERKYTGLTKPRMIARLLKLVSMRNEGKKEDDTSLENQGPCKKKRKKEYQVQLAVEEDDLMSNSVKRQEEDIVVCKNVACQAILSPGDAFCRRCSCCICQGYDDNKDPGLWLVCNSDPPYNGKSCGISCHLKCALKQLKASGLKNGDHAKIDGFFHCFCCGKVNDLIGSWRKQLLVAKDARRVDQLCERISLSYKILKGSERYKDLHAIVATAAKKLNKELGSLDKVSTKMARGIVNRLACGAEVQKLCALAINKADSVVTTPEFHGPPICCVRIENISMDYVVVSVEFEGARDVVKGCRLWHRESNATNYFEDPTCTIHIPDRKTKISGLTPSTEYYIKVSPFDHLRELGSYETSFVTEPSNNSNGNLSAVAEELENQAQILLIQSDSQKASTNSSDNRTLKPSKTRQNRSKVSSSEYASDNNERNAAPPSLDGAPFVCSNTNRLETPRKFDGQNDLPNTTNQKETSEREYEYCVKVIRWLECEGHMEKDFRVKFLTWFSLKASLQERRVVRAFIDVLIDEPDSLVDQLMDAFMDGICTKEKPVLPNGFCTRLWH